VLKCACEKLGIGRGRRYLGSCCHATIKYVSYHMIEDEPQCKISALFRKDPSVARLPPSNRGEPGACDNAYTG
jgi:hypothetical protein